MQSYSEQVHTESAAHRLRSEELARRLGTKSSFSGRRLLESCREFDAVAEFAALEGQSIGEALRQYVAEGSGSGYPELAACEHTGERLPVVPAAISRLLRTTVERVSIQELEAIAGSDPVLAGRLLSAANSARFGSRCRITTLREAILRLGIPEARRVLVSACIAGFFASGALSDIWKHSQSVAAAACEIAAQIGMDSESAWVAGLLHDIGRAALTTVAADRRIVEESWRDAGFPLVYSEALAHGQDHAEVGAALLKKWDLPADIVEAVALHHRPECSDSRLTAVLCLAEDLVTARSGSPEEDLWPAMRRTIACQRSGISPEDFKALKGGSQTNSACA